MGYIAPNSDVWICRGVPLDSRSKYTYRPSSKTAQFEAFSAYREYTLNAQSYIRHSNNTIRVALAPDTLLTCNYMMFRNTSFGNKIFYAFITDVEYVNNETSLITYSIDNIQTYFFDVSFNASYIEREHSITDNIGDSITPEPVITSGQEVISKYQSLAEGLTAGVFTVIVTSHNLLNPVVTDYVFQTATQGNFSGACLAGEYNVCNVVPSSLQDFFNVVNNYIRVAGENGILGMYLIPRMAYTDDGWDTNHPWLAPNVGINKIPSVYMQVVPKPAVTDKLGGYLPKNNKLYTYPFCFFRLNNSLGSSKDYRYEFFTTDNAVFRLSSSGVTPDQAVYCTPNNYRGFLLDWESSLIYDTYPATSFITSEYNDYIGNNSNRLLAGQLSRIVSAVSTFGTAPANPTGAITSLTGNVMAGMSEYATLKDLQAHTSTIGGTASGYFNLLFAQNFFIGYRVTVNATVAKQYDDFFTMYGYTVNALKVPQFAQSQRRKSYNYCKTRNACIRSLGATSLGIPDTALKDIQSALDGGLCLWETLANVGNFSVDNAL
nr:MAG TPA: Major tail protein [Caudoviricetes sp.]